MTKGITVSVILATRNRREVLQKTLESFLKLECLAEAEFLIVDNGSTDTTIELLESFNDKLNLSYWTQPCPGKNICLNQAIKRANGNLLVFTDDDVIADANWITEYKRAAQERSDQSIFGGKIDPLFPFDTPPEIHALESSFGVIYSKYSPCEQREVVKQPPFGPNLMIRRSVFEKVKYDESIGPAGKSYAMGSETELLLRLRDEYNMQYFYVPEARVQHIIREEQMDFAWVLSRANRAGRGFARIITTRRLRLFGVPWPILFKRYLAGMKLFCLAPFIGVEKKARLKWEIEKLKGCIFEFRNRSF